MPKLPLPPPKPAKKNRTLSLVDDRFERFQAYLKGKNVTASEVVDAWIERFLEEVANP